MQQKKDKLKEKGFYTFEEVKDQALGKVGEPERDEYETNLKTFLIGEMIRNVREDKKMTQAELGEILGVQRAQISRIESGKNITLNTLMRVFKALHVDLKLDIGKFGTFQLT